MAWGPVLPVAFLGEDHTRVQDAARVGDLLDLAYEREGVAVFAPIVWASTSSTRPILMPVRIMATAALPAASMSGKTAQLQRCAWGSGRGAGSTA